MEGDEKSIRSSFFFVFFVSIGIMAKLFFGHIEPSNKRWISEYMCVVFFLLFGVSGSV